MILLHIPKDGNCLFRALASFFQSPNIDHRLMRQMLLHYISQYPEQFEVDIVAEGYQSVQEYVQHMAYEKTWGDGACLQCFTMIFNVNVWLCYGKDTNEPPTLISEEKPGAPNLALLLTDNHYDRILSW
jgi:predicted adenine nucleotide alpha hydrolase (AANH) superfamily ATPase